MSFEFERFREGLRVLHTVRLRKLPFDMCQWAEEVDDNGKLPCGTAACAFGWIASDKWHRKQGLKLVDDISYGYTITFAPHRGFYAASEYFGISFKKANHFFSPSEYEFIPPIETVIKRMEKFLTKQEEKLL